MEVDGKFPGGNVQPESIYNYKYMKKWRMQMKFTTDFANLYDFTTYLLVGCIPAVVPLDLGLQEVLSFVLGQNLHLHLN